MESRDEIIKRIGRSPDYASAYLLALMNTPKIEIPRRREHRASEYDPYAHLETARDSYAAIR